MSKDQSLDDAILARVKNRRPLSPMTLALLMATSQMRDLAEAAAALARAGAAYTPPKAPPAPVVAAPTTPGPADDGERLTLGAINARLAPVSITGAGLTQLGFEPVTMEKNARMYRACDFPAICRALSGHVLALAEHEAANV